MMIRHRPLLAACCVLLCAAGTAAAAADGQVAELIGKLPLSPAAEGRKVIAEIVKLGPPAYEQLSRMLVVPGAGDDAKVRFAMHGLALYTTRPDAEAERRAYAAVLIKALQAQKNRELKAFLIRQLQLAGTDDAVAPVAGYLGDDSLCEPATQALIRIRTAQAQAALASALPGAKGKRLAMLIRALGQLRVKAAAKDIYPHAMSSDTAVRMAALWAVANIGDPSAIGVLKKAAEAKGTYARARATDFYLLLARRLAEAGDKTQCAAICRGLAKTRTSPREGNVVCAALGTLVSAAGEDALPDVLAAVAGPDKKIRCAALKLTAKFTGADVTKKLGEIAGKASPEARADILIQLGLRGDKAAVPATLQGLKAAEKPVRLAAITAARRLGTAESLAALFTIMGAGSADELSAVKAEMALLPEKKVLPAAAAAISNVPPKSAVALIQLLADRKATAHKEPVFDAMKTNDDSVRVAAAKALENVAEGQDLPRIVGLIANAKKSRESSALQKSYIGVCETVPDVEKRAEPILNALENAKAGQRTVLLGLLARTGGKRALQTVLADTKSKDTKTEDAAIRALCAWPSVDAAPALLELARSARSPVHQVLAMRGYLRVAGLPGKRSADETLKMYQAAMAAANRPDTRKAVIGGLAGVRSIAALQLVAKYLDDKDLSAEACLAAYKMAAPGAKDQPGLRGKVVVDVLTKVLGTTKDNNLRQMVQKLLLTLPKSDDANVAMGKSVQASVAQQGNQAPELAVDGISNDKGSGFWASRWPCTLTVDLEQPTKIDCVQVFFYWDGTRYYQYSVAVSPGNEKWKTVVDCSKTTEKPTEKGFVHHFAAETARYVRLNIIKNSVNEAAHLVEFKVFAAGKGPKPKATTWNAKPIPKNLAEKDFTPLFNGKNLDGWTGSTKGYVAENGLLVCRKRGGGNLYTAKEYADFIFRFEFKLEPGANNGLGIRTPTQGNAAYAGMELQILDDTSPQYAKLDPRQYHGSIYGVVAAKRGHQKPLGQWNRQEVVANGPHLVVNLNGAAIVDADLEKAMKGQKMGNARHPGLANRKGRLGFLGHGARIEFRNLRIYELK